jgi:hypothetical protein
MDSEAFQRWEESLDRQAELSKQVDRLENQVQALKSSLIIAYQIIAAISFLDDSRHNSNEGVVHRNQCKQQMSTLNTVKPFRRG